MLVVYKLQLFHSHQPFHSPKKTGTPFEFTRYKFYINSSRTPCVPHPFHPLLFDHPNKMWARVQITKLLITQFSAFSFVLLFDWESVVLSTKKSSLSPLSNPLYCATYLQRFPLCVCWTTCFSQHVSPFLQNVHINAFHCPSSRKSYIFPLFSSGNEQYYAHSELGRYGLRIVNLRPTKDTTATLNLSPTFWLTKLLWERPSRGSDKHRRVKQKQ
jgi:hypothetical protein